MSQHPRVGTVTSVAGKTLPAGDTPPNGPRRGPGARPRAPRASARGCAPVPLQARVVTERGWSRRFRSRPNLNNSRVGNASHATTQLLQMYRLYRMWYFLLEVVNASNECCRFPSVRGLFKSTLILSMQMQMLHAVSIGWSFLRKITKQP